MTYKLNYDKVPDALSSEPLRCFICQAMRHFMQEEGPSMAAYIDSVSQCSVYLTVFLTRDVDLNNKEAIETFMLNQYYNLTESDVGVPTTAQAKYVLNITERIIEAAKDCLTARTKEGR